MQNDSVQFHPGNRGLEAFVLFTVPQAFGGAIREAAGVWNQVEAAVGVRYVGDSYMETTNTLVNAAYTVFDAGLHYRQPKGMNFALNVKNIGNDDHAQCTVTGGCQYITPRVITATASYRW